MRSYSVIALLACAAAATSICRPATALAADQFPYTAYCNSEDVYIRSGPGKNYYATDKLPKGTSIQVYRHDPGGWYAIRPTNESFSWVPADAIKPKGDRLGVVQREGTVCFVGTRFSNAHEVHQVKLEKGEEVEILDIKQLGEGAGSQAWAQISPPSGEFRWVYGKFLDREPPSGLSKPRDAAASRERDAFVDRSSSSRETDDRPSDWVGKNSDGTTTKPDQTGHAQSDIATWRASAERRPGTDKPGASPPDPFQQELDTIDMEVSRIAADEPVTWEFAAQKRRAEALLGRSNTALERGRVRLILNRIARFEDVKRRSDLLSQPGSATAPSALASVPTPKFDGVGRLTTVTSKRPNSPQFALLDSSNHVVSFVTPTPGVNLQQYIGQEVGVSGQRGYIPDLQTPHVTAQRIEIMDSTRLR